MKTKIGRFNVSQSSISEGNGTASSVKEKGGINMVNHKEMSLDAQSQKEENKMKTAVKEKLRFFKEFTSVVSNAAKAGWDGNDFDAETFAKERGFDTLFTKEEQEEKSAEDTSKAEKKKKETKTFLDSIGEASEPKKSEVETPVKEEESDVEETVVEETTQKTEETPAGGKFRPAVVKVSKLFNHVVKFGAEGVRRVKGGYQWTKTKVLGLAKSGFKRNILGNLKMLGTGVLAMYSGLTLGIQSVYIFGLLTMILSLRVVLPVVIVLGLIELFFLANREEEANA